MRAVHPVGHDGRVTALETETEAYLHRLERALVGPRRVRASLLREAGDHLADGTRAYVEAGYDADEAAALAVADFGRVEEVAPGFQSTLAVAASRRTAWLLLGACLIQPFLWDGGLDLSASHEPTAAAHPGFAWLDAGVEVVGVLVMAGALLALVGTGIGNRWFAAGPAVARLTGWFAIAGAALVPAIGVVMVLTAGVAGLASVWLVMLVGLVTPMAVAARSAQLCLRAC